MPVRSSKLCQSKGRHFRWKNTNCSSSSGALKRKSASRSLLCIQMALASNLPAAAAAYVRGQGRNWKLTR
ncbi:hypothetical protein D9M68_877800 [compost metagenome]